ncbi:MAG TPA: Hsp20/alpha crystallin family protein [Acidimicrobiales bacterium]
MAELDRMQDRLSQLIDVWSWPSFFEDGAALADVEEPDDAYLDAYLVELDVPGVDKSDLEIQLVRHRLIVSGVRKEGEHRGVLRHRTRTVGEFRHEILLPGDVDPAQVSASLADGGPTVRLATPASEKPKAIKVGGGRDAASGAKEKSAGNS